MHVVIGGASGFLGSTLADTLRDGGHQVTRLVREPSGDHDASLWDPAVGHVDQAVIDSADAVVNLSGSSIAQWPRTERRKQELIDSRVSATQTLAHAVAKATQLPALMSGSGMSWYGTDRGTEVLDETATAGTGFMPDLAQQWEAAARPASEAGARVCLLRTSLVLGKSGGMLQPLLPAFKFGLGAQLGSGRQRMSLITVTDWARAVEFCLTNEVSGPINLAMRTSVTNAEFTKALAAAVRRPTVLKAPAFVLDAVLGDLSDDLLGSLDIVPAALENAGFEFTSTSLSHAIEAAIR